MTYQVYYFFPNETFYLVCFFAYCPLVHNRIGGQKARNAGFWHSGRLFALLQTPSLQNLKDFLVNPPLNPLLLLLTPPF